MRPGTPHRMVLSVAAAAVLAAAGCATHKERFCGYGLVEEDGGGFFYQRDGGGFFVERDGGGFFVRRDGINPGHQVTCRPGVPVEDGYNTDANFSVKGS